MGLFDHLLRDIRSVIDRDGAQNAIPPLDGAFSPNDRLDSCEPIGTPLPGLDDVAVASDGTVYVSAGRQVLKLTGDRLATRTVVAEFEDDAGGLALHPDGRLLVCVAGRGLAAIDPAKPVPSWFEAADGRGFAGLLSVAAAPDGRIFVAQQSGALRVIKNGALLTAPFITLSVSSTGERGLIGVTLDPDFNTNHYLYLYHTTTEGGTHNRITRFTANGDVALAGSASIEGRAGNPPISAAWPWTGMTLPANL